MARPAGSRRIRGSRFGASPVLVRGRVSGRPRRLKAPLDSSGASGASQARGLQRRKQQEIRPRSATHFQAGSYKVKDLLTRPSCSVSGFAPPRPAGMTASAPRNGPGRRRAAYKPADSDAVELESWRPFVGQTWTEFREPVTRVLALTYGKLRRQRNAARTRPRRTTRMMQAITIDDRLVATRSLRESRRADFDKSALQPALPVFRRSC